jgi:hypothetical protein
VGLVQFRDARGKEHRCLDAEGRGCLTFFGATHRNSIDGRTGTFEIRDRFLYCLADGGFDREPVEIGTVADIEVSDPLSRVGRFGILPTVHAVRPRDAVGICVVRAGEHLQGEREVSCRAGHRADHAEGTVRTEGIGPGVPRNEPEGGFDRGDPTAGRGRPKRPADVRAHGEGTQAVGESGGRPAGGATGVTLGIEGRRRRALQFVVRPDGVAEFWGVGRPEHDRAGLFETPHGDGRPVGDVLGEGCHAIRVADAGFRIGQILDGDRDAHQWAGILAAFDRRLYLPGALAGSAASTVTKAFVRSPRSSIRSRWVSTTETGERSPLRTAAARSVADRKV